VTPVEARLLFPTLLGRLLTFAADNGIPVQLGECYRTPQQAAWNAAHGKGIATSLHTERLAVDLLCFRKHSGKWTWLQVGNEPEYRALGEHWESLHPDCAWGGRFNDAGHFSLRIDNRK
jgi:hypothetical protein